MAEDSPQMSEGLSSPSAASDSALVFALWTLQARVKRVVSEQAEPRHKGRSLTEAPKLLEPVLKAVGGVRTAIKDEDEEEDDDDDAEV